MKRLARRGVQPPGRTNRRPLQLTSLQPPLVDPYAVSYEPFVIRNNEEAVSSWRCLASRAKGIYSIGFAVWVGVGCGAGGA
jgi:hypothetical protein